MILSSIVSGTHRTHGDELIAVVHHRDQEVEQHDDVDQREAAKHDQPPEPEYNDIIIDDNLLNIFRPCYLKRWLPKVIIIYFSLKYFQPLGCWSALIMMLIMFVIRGSIRMSSEYLVNSLMPANSKLSRSIMMLIMMFMMFMIRVQ